MKNAFQIEIPKPKGFLSFEVWDKDQLHENGDPIVGEEPRIYTPFQPQLILDVFYEHYLNATLGNVSREAFFTYGEFGIETTAPNASDTSHARIAGSSKIAKYDAGYTYSVSGNQITSIMELRSTQGQIVGTATSFALYQNSTPGVGTPYMKSLIKDVNGNPTSLVLTSSDFIYVKWKTISTVDLTSKFGTILLGEPGSEILYNWELKPAFWNIGLINTSTIYNFFVPVATNNGPSSGLGLNNAYAYPTQTLGAVTAGPTGTSYVFSSQTAEPYVAGSKKRVIAFKWGINQGNDASGLSSFAFQNSTSQAGFQLLITAASGGGRIPKNNQKELILKLELAFGR